jgi:hypothetical protein
MGSGPDAWSEYYRRLDDHDLARLLLTEELLPEAREAATQELTARGITDLRAFEERIRERTTPGWGSRSATRLSFNSSGAWRCTRDSWCSLHGCWRRVCLPC